MAGKEVPLVEGVKEMKPVKTEAEQAEDVRLANEGRTALEADKATRTAEDQVAYDATLAKLKGESVGDLTEAEAGKPKQEKSPERIEAEFKMKQLDEKLSFERGRRDKADGALEYLALTRPDNDTAVFGEFAREMTEVDTELASLESRKQQISYDSGILQEQSPSQSPDELKQFVESVQKSQAEKIRIGKGTLAKPGYETAQSFMVQIRKNLEQQPGVKKISNVGELMDNIKSRAKQFATEKRPIPYAYSQKALGISLAALKVKEFRTAADAVALAEASGQPSMREIEDIIKTMDGPSRQKFQEALEYSRGAQEKYQQ